MKRRLSLLLILVMLTTSYGSALAETLKLPANLTTIGEKAFLGASSLDEVDIPWGTETIGSKAFANSSVTKVYIPDTVNEIARDAFEGTNATIVSSGVSFAHFFALQNKIDWENADSAEEVPLTIENYEAYLFPDEPLEPIPLSGISDPKAIREIEEFNASLEDLNEMIAEYNQNIRSMIENINEIISIYQEVSITETDNGITITGKDYDFTISGNAIELLDENSELVDYLDDDTLYLKSCTGQLFYLTYSDNQIVISQEASLRKSRASNEEVRKSTTGAAIETANNVYGYVNLVWDATKMLVPGIYPGVYKGFDFCLKYLDCYNPVHYKILLEWWKASDIADFLKPWLEKINNVLDFLNPTQAVLGVASSIASVYFDQQKKVQIGNIRKHGHPTDGEMYEQAYQLVMEMLSDLLKAENRYTADQVGSFLGGLLSAYTQKPGLNDKLLKTLNKLALGLDGAGIFATNSANGYFNSALQKDALLHWAVTGCVKDEDTKENLPYTVVTCMMGDYGEVKVVTDGDGIYYVEPLSSTATLQFQKDGYGIKEATVSMQRNLIEVQNMDLKEEKGMVFGYAYDVNTNERLSDVAVYVGDSINPTAHTDENGDYSLTLPTKEVQLTFKKEGYEDYPASVTPVYEESVQVDAPMASESNLSQATVWTYMYVWDVYQLSVPYEPFANGPIYYVDAPGIHISWPGGETVSGSDGRATIMFEGDSVTIHCTGTAYYDGDGAQHKIKTVNEIFTVKKDSGSDENKIRVAYYTYGIPD